MYEKHNQVSAIDFIDYVFEKFPFRIHTIRTDRGHEFQARFHWHVNIEPGSPLLNGKYENFHLIRLLAPPGFLWFKAKAKGVEPGRQACSCPGQLPPVLFHYAYWWRPCTAWISLTRRCGSHLLDPGRWHAHRVPVCRYHPCKWCRLCNMDEKC